MQKTYKALVVDDERLARRDLISMLKEYKSIEIAGEADNVSSALQAIETHRPDVVFLDIQMPGESGFELIEKLSYPLRIIFVTAYDQHAIRAFEVNALDYLLKPVHPDRLATSIERLDTSPPDSTENWRPLDYNDRLFLMLDDRMQFLKISEIMSIKAAGDYSELYLVQNRKRLTTKTMKEWEQRLPDTYFTRIHRSSIINMEYIERLEEWFNYSYKVYLRGMSEPLVMSRRYVARLKHRMG